VHGTSDHQNKIVSNFSSPSLHLLYEETTLSLIVKNLSFERYAAFFAKLLAKFFIFSIVPLKKLSPLEDKICHAFLQAKFFYLQVHNIWHKKIFFRKKLKKEKPAY
jgi:hypothetical protein